MSRTRSRTVGLLRARARRSRITSARSSGFSPVVLIEFVSPTRPSWLFLDVPAGEDARHEAEHVGRAHVAVPIIADQAALDHVDLLLRRLVHHAGHQAGQLD